MTRTKDKLYFLEVFFTNSPPPVIKYESASRCFQLEEGPSRGLLHVCKIFVYLWITFVSSYTVRMGAPYAVFIMKSVNTINLDPALFEGPKYSPEMNNHNKTGSNDPSIKETTLLPKNFAGPRHGQYVQPVLVIILLIATAPQPSLHTI